MRQKNCLTGLPALGLPIKHKRWYLHLQLIWVQTVLIVRHYNYSEVRMMCVLIPSFGKKLGLSDKEFVIFQLNLTSLNPPPFVQLVVYIETFVCKIYALKRNGWRFHRVVYNDLSFIVMDIVSSELYFTFLIIPVVQRGVLKAEKDNRSVTSKINFFMIYLTFCLCS